MVWLSWVVAAVMHQKWSLKSPSTSLYRMVLLPHALALNAYLFLVKVAHAHALYYQKRPKLFAIGKLETAHSNMGSLQDLRLWRGHCLWLRLQWWLLFELEHLSPEVVGQ